MSSGNAIIGIIEKVGEYQGNAYDNVYIHCTYEDGNCLAGVLTETLKIKASNLNECFGTAVTPDFWKLLIGEEIMQNYNKFGAVQSILIRNTKQILNEGNDGITV